MIKNKEKEIAGTSTSSLMEVSLRKTATIQLDIMGESDR